MYKLSIVDDEHFVLERLKQMIAKIDDPNITLKNSFNNGDDAYNNLSVDPPDILITDIHIPFINGMELARMLKKVNPLMKIIVITGYEELSYAKEAIALEVVGFISKPISYDELASIIEKAKTKIIHEQNLESNIDEFNQFYSDNLPILKETYLSELFDYNEINLNLSKQLQRINLNIDYERLITAYFDYDKYYEDEEKEKFEMLLQKQLYSFEVSFELFHKNNALIVLFKNNQRIDFEVLNDFLKLVILKANNQFNIKVTVGVSNMSKKPHNYRKMYLESQRAISSRRLLGGLKVFLYNDIKDDKKGNSLLNDLSFNRLTHLVRFEHNESKIKEQLERLKEKVLKPEHTNLYEFNLSNILNAILKAASDDINLNNFDVNYNKIYQDLFRLKTVDNVFDMLYNLAIKIQKTNLEQIQTKADHNMDLIKNYLQNNYKNKDLNLDMLAEDISFSISYITTLFKKIEHTTFVKYLTKIRMNQAEQLLTKTNKKIIEIANEIGYNDPYYFSHSFKKYYGVSPKEYRDEKIRT